MRATSAYDLCEGWSLWREFQVRGAGFSTEALIGFHKQGTFEERRRAERAHLRSLYSQPRLQEAVVWQNTTAAKYGMYGWLATPAEPERAKTRKRERKFLSYLSRYASKNDVIGYFGPIGWGELAAETEVSPLSHELARRTVYEEPWVVERLLEVWEQEHDFLDPLPLRLSARLAVEGDWLLGSGARRRDGKRQLTDDEAALLHRVADGQPADWDGLLGEGFSDETVLRCVNRGWLLRGVAVPSVPHPLQWLHNTLRECGVDRRYLEPLEELQDLKRRVEEQRGHPESLLEALDTFSARLKQLTQKPAERAAGQTYGGRQPLYEDCQRAGRLKLAELRLASIDQALSAVLESCRWFCFQSSQRFGQLLDELYVSLASRYGERFCLTYLWDALQQALCAPDALGLSHTADEMAKCWSSIFGENVTLSPEDALKQAGQLFSSPTPSYPGGRYHSVDLLFPNLEAGPIVLGEIHPGIHPFGTMSAFHQHQDRDALIERTVVEREGDRVLPALHLPYTRSAHDSWHAPADHHLLVCDQWGSWRAPDKWLRLGRLSAQRCGSSFSITDGHRSWNPTAFFERELRIKTTLYYAPFPLRDSYRPRRRIGELVVCREAWRFATSELSFLGLKDVPQAARLAQIWADEKGLPAQMFVRIASETKPFLWDTKSVLSTESMIHSCRKEASVKLEEMLPGLEDGWLRNPDGLGLCELRMVARDTSSGGEGV